MSGYLARLKNIHADNLANTRYPKPTEPTKGAFDGFVGSPMGHIVKINSAIQVISNWWLFDYSDVESVQFAIWPPATYAEAIKLNPTAISATPLQSPHMKTVNIDTPQALLDLMFLGGYSVSVNGDSLEVSQAHWIDEELAALITSHKVGLIKILESEL